ncbi:MAG TPA: primosomal protein N', partial [Syntrophomonadaceae bacterium]|nr:primosomal protein N' [Syntrophomonadaceae bacterium]
QRQQVILFINRRGYSPMTICRECGTIATCPRCSVGMTYHKDTKQHLCHYCNYRATPKRQCEKCGSHYLQLAGIGTQKVEEEIIAAYPQARVRRLDLDSSRRKGVQKTIIKDMMNGNIDILIGTQMVAKGLDFPAVSLVGVIDADSMLNLPDFRAAERCFQLLVQAAGRAGRSDTPGEVVIQTYQPDHPVILLAAEQDYPSFYRYELSRRQLLQYPPFTHILRIVISARNERLLKNYVQEFAVFIEELLGANEGEFWILGPAPCPIQKINKVFRYQILLKSSSLPLLQSANEYIYLRKRPQGIRLEQDLNPIATM